MTTLKELRLKRGLTQSELAKLLKISRVSVTDWENGKAEPRQLKTLVELAKILKCSVDIVVKALQKNSKN